LNIRENIRIAVFSIRTNLMRSLLTMLGIIIGVASVIAIVTVGNGGRDYIVGMIRDMGNSAIALTVNMNMADSFQNTIFLHFVTAFRICFPSAAVLA
jgi:putative ABC transport system permease protein